MSIDIQLMTIDILLPHEYVDLDHVIHLKKLIVKDGHWNQPIVIDRKSNIVMDGHHRLEAAKKVGLRKIPCAIFDYFNDNVSVIKMGTEDAFDVSLIKLAAESGQKLPIKSTMHVLGENVAAVQIPLDELR